MAAPRADDEDFQGHHERMWPLRERTGRANDKERSRITHPTSENDATGVPRTFAP
ncbi:hypothetical protein [[Pseudopropionibacterium] massiliense]|uniref:hypothetical protein n=1 Tax=[Pseudopropionibacterium] massiliense TaxID=2220000 RepID=UPI0013EF2996|nr:hypothetical protein [[Pseudopropionibacterium] massiliense]